MKSIRHLMAIGLLFIMAGLLMGSGRLFDNWRSRHASAFGTPPSSSRVVIDTNKPLIQGKPTRIRIPSVSIDIAVIDGYYYANSNSWTLTKDKAQYATMTPYANNREGNTFIYGHSLPAVFKRITQLKPGAEALVYTDNDHVFKYKLTSMYVTNPSDNSVFKYHGPPILTLQTCTGLWYQNRSMFAFSFKEVT